MLAVLSWWVAMEALGLLALPITLRLFRHLPERGYAFAKPLGLLLAGYLWWIGSVFGFLSVSRTAILFAMAVVGMASLWIWRRQGEEMAAFLRQNRRMVIATELVFAAAFAGWAFVRAHNPEIAATEKPMEIAFLNAILRSPRFPPHDPWLSGFAISYYYFGYLLVALLTKLSGVAPSVAFNLAISLLFALTISGSFSLVYNLVTAEQMAGARRRLANLLWALLGPLFVAVIGNLEGLFEVLHTRGWGSAGFWRWLDVNDLQQAPINGRFIPTDMWWWWRASRVVNDRDLQGVHQEVIDEFPQFSFLLGDMHPHVLALPFVLLVVALALNVLLGARSWVVEADDPEAEKPTGGMRSWLARARCVIGSLWQGRVLDLLLLALCLGALGFLNTWDLPIHLVVVLGAFVVAQRQQQQRTWLSTTVAFAVSVVVPAVLFYLPFYLGFQSQAGGVLPNFFNVTRVHQFLLMFGLFVFVIASLVLSQARRAFVSLPAEERRTAVVELATSVLWLVVGPLLLMLLAVLLVVGTSAGRQFLQGLLENPQVQALIGNAGVMGLLRQAVLRRLGSPWTFLLMVVLLALLWWLVQRSWQREIRSTASDEAVLPFVYLIAGVAFLLTLAVEFIYLRDLFGTRMNTVFKFYYQAWVLMAIAAAFGSYYLVGRSDLAASRRSALGRGVWLVAFVGLVLVGMIYPVLGIPNKAGDFKGVATLDGMAFLQGVRPDDYAAMRWLQANVRGMAYIVEATGGSYTDSSFVSAFTGLPTILGWDFHQYQWRGNTIESGKRQPDIAQIYQSADSKQVLALLDKYDVDYVYLGPVEKRKYELASNVPARLERFLEVVYEGGDVRIYRRR